MQKAIILRRLCDLNHNFFFRPNMAMLIPAMRNNTAAIISTKCRTINMALAPVFLVGHFDDKTYGFSSIA